MEEESDEMQKMPPRITNAQLWWGQQQTLAFIKEMGKRVSALELSAHDSDRERRVMKEQIASLQGYVASAEDSRKILRQLRAFVVGAVPATPLIVAVGHHFGVW